MTWPHQPEVLGLPPGDGELDTTGAAGVAAACCKAPSRSSALRAMAAVLGAALVV